MQKNLIITLLFSILIAVFAILNATAVPVNLIFTKVDISAALVILISASIGAIIVSSLDFAAKLKAKKKYLELEKKHEISLKEIASLNEQLVKKNNEKVTPEIVKEDIINTGSNSQS